MEFIVWMVHVLVAVTLVGLILLQHGKGADMGAAFGSGASGSLFGASGSANFLSRFTSVLATLFFLTSMALTYFSSIAKTESAPMAVPTQPVDAAPEQTVRPDADKSGAIPK